jgi:hypothetical protein
MACYQVLPGRVVCYWSAAKLGMRMVDLMRKSDLTAAAVSIAVHRGEKIAKNYQLALSDICISTVPPHAQGGAETCAIFGDDRKYSNNLPAGIF